jgi:outer membrane lipoprotein carrier protein
VSRRFSAIVVLLAVVLSAVWGAVAFAVTPDSEGAMDAALDGLSARYQGLSALTADYSRTTVSPSTDAVFGHQASQTASGKLSWRRLAMLRLDQETPTKELMLTDGDVVWWHLPAEKRAYVYRDLDLAGELSPLLSFFSGLEALRENFLVDVAAPDDSRQGQIALELKPKRGSERVGRLIIYCDAESRLTGFRLSSPTGEKTDFHLVNLSADPRLARGLFEFRPPRGTVVIEEE